MDAQKEAMEDYCAKKGLKIVNSYSAIESSTSGKRVVFHEMLDFVKKQKKKTAKALSVDHFVRTSGPEKQGSIKLEDWKPHTLQDIQTYS